MLFGKSIHNIGNIITKVRHGPDIDSNPCLLKMLFKSEKLKKPGCSFIEFI